MLAACAANLGNSSSSSLSQAQPPDQQTTAAALANANQPAAPVKIAMLLPLDGMSQAAVVAKAMKQAGEMALFERDKPNVQLIVKDDRGTVDGAKAAAVSAVQDGAEIIVGPLFARSVAGAAEVGRSVQPQVPILAFSNDRQAAGNGAYLMSQMPAPEVDRVIDYATRTGKRRYVALIPDDAYGHIVEQAFRAAVSRNGGVILALERYPLNSNGMLEPVQKALDLVKAGDAVDAIFLPGGQDVLPRIGPLIKYAGIDTATVKLIGTGAWDYPNLGRDPVFIGGWYASADPRGWNAFSERFTRMFGQAPPRLATVAYDAVNAAIALSDLPPGSRYTADTLTRSQGFEGVEGNVRLLPDGTASRALAILEVQRFGSKVIDSATNASAYAVGAAYTPPVETGGLAQPQPYR